MGNTGSTLQANQAEKICWDPVQERSNIPYHLINDYSFYLERTLSFFVILNEENDYFPFSKKENHKSQDLVQLLLGYYEELDNIPQIIETIIEGGIESENNVVKYLCYCFHRYLQNAENIDSLNNFNSDFLYKFSSPFKIRSLKTIKGFGPPFSTLLATLSTSLLLLEDPNLPFQSIIPFVDFFNYSLTTCCITPPTPEFLPENRKYINEYLLPEGYVYPHGVSSNGKFLFILCSNLTLLIFPLLNNGTLSSLISVSLSFLNIPIPAEPSITAFEDHLAFYFNSVVVNINIFQLIQSQVQSPKFDVTSTSCTASDGITQVAIKKDHMFNVFDIADGKQISSGKFEENDIWLPYDLSTVVIETNGNFISFIIQQQRGNDNMAVYKTFSMEGKPVCQESFVMNEQIIASCIDSIHKCHWSVISAGDSRFFLRRYAFFGGENSRVFDISKYSYPIPPEPSSFAIFNLIISGLHRHLKGMINSHISPSIFLVQRVEEFYKLIEILEKIIDYPQNKIGLIKETQKAAEESLVILISLNMKRIRCTSEPFESIALKILDLIKKLPLNLAALMFFSNFDYLIYNQDDNIIIMLINLLKSINSNSFLMSFAFRTMEETKSLSMISFKNSNGLFYLIPQDCTDLSLTQPNIIIFLLIHQRCLIRESRKFLKNDPLAVINFLNSQTDNSATVLDQLGNYIQTLFSIFETVLTNSEPTELSSSSILTLFSNFIRLLSSLAEFHSVAQVAIATLSMIVVKLEALIKLFPKFVLDVVFIFGKFAATLLKGGIMSDLETKFLWLIRPNVNLIDQPDLINNLDSEMIESFKDDRINMFLNSEGNSIEAIYKKIKPQINRNLNYRIKEIDRLSLVAFSKHLGCLDEMLFFDGTKNPSPLLRSAFDQTLSVRSSFRSCLQNNKDPTFLKVKCLMLLRMANDKEINPKSLCDFVVSKIEPAYFKKIIFGQRKRIETTLVGFALLDQIYSKNVDPLVHQIIGYNLSMIESFEGLSSIMRIYKLSENQEKQILTFFQRIISSVTKEKSIILIMVAYRFFRDVDSLTAVQNSVLISVLEALDLMPKSYSLFALALSLIKGINMIPPHLLRTEGESYRWLLLYESTKYVLPSQEFVSNLIQKFWFYKPKDMRLVLRVIYNIQEIIIDPHVIFSTFLQFIGEKIKLFQNLSVCNEIIYFLRKILISENAPLKKTLTIYLLSANLSNATEEFMLGIFCVLGLNIEEIRPYSTINYHPNRSEMVQYYAIPYGRNKYMFYPKPFHLFTDKIQSIPDKSEIYAVPIIEITPEQFPYFDYIFSFFLPLSQLVQTTTVTFAIYMQVFASFCCNSNFVLKTPPEILLKLYEEPISFHDIQETIKCINYITKIGVNQTVCDFNVLSYDRVDVKTFLSPVLIDNLPIFELVINIPIGYPKFEYIGIVSDNLEPYYTRYSIVSYPEGSVFPFDTRQRKEPFRDLLPYITVLINMPNRQFSIGNRVYQFPIGSQFRILYATKNPRYREIQFAIRSDFPVFNLNSRCPIQKFDVSDTKELYPIPKWAFEMAQELPNNISKFPNSRNFIMSYSREEKVQSIFTIPPSSILIHCFYSTAASPPILQTLYLSAFYKLAMQYSTVSLMRIININADFCKPVVYKLFKYFILTLESFSLDLTNQGYFPFSINEPVWKSEVDPIYLSMENEVKKALIRIISDTDNINKIGFELWNFSNSKRMHSLMLPQENLFIFMVPPSNYNILKDQIKIIFNDDFNGPSIGEMKIQRNLVNLPLIYKKKNTAMLVDFLNKERPIGILSLNQFSNDWVINTPIELFLLLKNFIYVAPQDHRPMIKSIILDCFISRSPVAACYLHFFSDFIQMQIPSTPLDQNPDYLARLALVGSLLKTFKDPSFANFYQKEQKLMSNKIAADLACHFPEFFSSPLPPPKSKMCQIPVVTVNPGALKVDFTAHILTLRLFSKSYESIVGFPFWEILPYWIKITGLGREENSSPDSRRSQINNEYEFVPPKITRISNEILKVTNPSVPNLKVVLKKKSLNLRIPLDSILMYDTSSMFEEASYVQFNNFFDPIYISTGDTYFSLNTFDESIQSPWNLLNLTLDYVDPTSSRNSHNRNSRRNHSENKESSRIIVVEINQIRQQFIDDMKQFAVDWKESDTNELLNQIPNNSFLNERFDSIEQIARTSSLTSVFNPTVVVLRALILHHFNFIHSIYHKEVSEDIWRNFSSFMSIDIASQSFLSSIASTHYTKGTGPNFEIDRRAARELIANGRGNRKDCIISQLSVIIQKLGVSNFRNKEKPWTVSFKSEYGIDAGGLARELLVEASTSIFEKTSNLMVQVDASSNGESRFYYVPNEEALGSASEFYTIGVIIGIIIRTGLLQDLPFAPIVWKAVAGEPITDEDVFDSDRLFKESFREINNNFSKLSRLNADSYTAPSNGNHGTIVIRKNWTVDRWDGKTVPLPHRDPKSFVETSLLPQYQRECLTFRKQAIKPMLDSIRKGFVDNIDLKSHYLMKGSLLSRLAQGSGKITIEQMKAITEVSGFPDGKNDRHILIFWEAVSRFNDEQMKLLFKFITTLTRLPSSARMDKGFKISIDVMPCENPDIMMPTASTCFNKLHLPLYTNVDVAYQKILYAVKFCSSMENK